MASITDFAAKFKGGVRSNLFKINITCPGISFVDLDFLATASSLPEQTLGKIEVPFRGRKLQVPGDRTFADWTVTILNDPEFQNRSAMEYWMGRISAWSANYSQYDRNDTNYYGAASISQLDRQQNVIRTYRMHVFPTTIAAITVDHSSNDEVEKFDTTFAVSSMSTDGAGADASSSGTGVDFSASGQIQVGDVTIGINI